LFELLNKLGAAELLALSVSPNGLNFGFSSASVDDLSYSFPEKSDEPSDTP
jgi:hypothetical protein